MPARPTEIEVERLNFRELTLANPNYFGTVKGSNKPIVKHIARNIGYEELRCVGYQPQLGQLEAVVHLKRNSGYRGTLCSGGSQEYVRFYLSFDGGTTWQDQGMSLFTAYDTPGPRPLEYAVIRPVDPPRKFCLFENLIKVRAILSWDAPPTPNTPDFTPVWGNLLDADIQVEPLRIFNVKELIKATKIKLSPDLEQLIDMKQALSMALPKALTLEQKVEAYTKAEVPAYRFLFDLIEPLLMATPRTMVPAQMDLANELQKFKIDLTEVIGTLLKTDGDVSYEELTCVGYDPVNDALVGVINVKKSSGYSGKLCSTGSREFVAFWIDWGAGWEYVGTTSVKVHDIASIPNNGLNYAVMEAINVAKRRKPCQEGPVTARVRAILSWQSPPSPTNPDAVPRWGNREETTIQVGPGLVGDLRPIIESISSVPVCSIDQFTGRTSAGADQPFGGLVTITGFIPNAPDILTPDASKMRYRVQVRSLPGGAWQALANEFPISVIERIGAGLPSQRTNVQSIEPDGYYIYREDMNVGGAGWRLVQNRVLAHWITAHPMTGMYEIKVEAKDPTTNVIYSAMTLTCTDGSTRTTVKVRLDEIAPDCSIAITGVQRGGRPLQAAIECETFLVGDIIHGTYSVADEHFGSLSLYVEPSTAGGAIVSPSNRAYPIVPTAGENGTWTLNTSSMKPCGYIVRLWVRDRSIVSGDPSGWKASASVGFCLK